MGNYIEDNRAERYTRVDPMKIKDVIADTENEGRVVIIAILNNNELVVSMCNIIDSKLYRTRDCESELEYDLSQTVYALILDEGLSKDESDAVWNSTVSLLKNLLTKESEQCKLK